MKYQKEFILIIIITLLMNSNLLAQGSYDHSVESNFTELHQCDTHEGKSDRRKIRRHMRKVGGKVAFLVKKNHRQYVVFYFQKGTSGSYRPRRSSFNLSFNVI